MRFLGFDLGAPTPDENTIRLYRDKLTESGALMECAPRIGQMGRFAIDRGRAF